MDPRFEKRQKQVKLFLGSWAFNALMSVIFAQQFSRLFAGALCVFLYYKGAGWCHSSNPDNQIDNQEDKWLLLEGAALVLIFIFFS